VAAALLTVVLLAPMAIERAGWVGEQEEKSDATLAALHAEGSDVDGALALALQRGGRIYAGLPHTYAAAFLLGYMPVYGLSALKLVPTLGFSYNESVFVADSMANFAEARPSH
jgi:hypothetical protein